MYQKSEKPTGHNVVHNGLMADLLFIVPIHSVFVKPLQLLKASSPIDVTELGMVTEVKLVQRTKAHLPIDITELPMVTEFKPLQSKKAA